MRAGYTLVVLDTPGPDPAGAAELASHRIFARAGVLVVENACNLELLGPGVFDVAALPLPVRGADGAPVRAAAWLGG